jgi:hypothetical protein
MRATVIGPAALLLATVTGGSQAACCTDRLAGWSWVG